MPDMLGSSPISCHLPMGFNVHSLQLRNLHVQRAASRLWAAAANAAQSQTVVLRQPDVSDGAWDRADARLVQQALDDSRAGPRERAAEQSEQSALDVLHKHYISRILRYADDTCRQC